MTEKTVLLVEDSPDDRELALRAFRKHRLTNQIAVAKDGAEAIDWLFCQGAHADRDPADLPAVVLLDLKLPQDGTAWRCCVAFAPMNPPSGCRS